MTSDLDLNTIGQVRVELAELRGMMTTVVADHSRRITDVEKGATQLRTDLTAVNDGINSRISQLLAEGNLRGQAIQTDITKNTQAIIEVNKDIAEIQQRQMGFGMRIAAYVSPIVAVAALLFTFYEASVRR